MPFVICVANYASARNLLNCTAMDIMYYTSPLFRMEIWSALQLELNRLYQMFTQRNPTFEANGGKVSIVSHSLGNNSPAGYLKYFRVSGFPTTDCRVVMSGYSGYS